MTYRDAANWAIENIPMNTFDNYSDWYDKAQEELPVPELFEEVEFNNMLQDAWEDTIGPIEKTRTEIEEEEITQRREALEQTPLEEYADKEVREEIIRNVPISESELPEYRAEREVEIKTKVIPQEIGAPIRVTKIEGITRVQRPPLPKRVDVALKPLPPKQEGIVRRFISGLRRLFSRR